MTDIKPRKDRRLDWGRLLGFDQIQDRRAATRSGALAGKIGVKLGSKEGIKVLET
ncbi:MAG: hypothetical protein ACFBQW_00180 [Sphingomonadaceae bacterium]